MFKSDSLVHHVHLSNLKATSKLSSELLSQCTYVVVVLQKLKDCFESKDISMLQNAILELPKEEAELHMKRCVESGLWVPNAKDAEEAETAEEGGNGDSGEDVYDEVK